MRINKSLLLGATLVCCCPFIGKTQSLLGITDSIQSATQPLPPLESTWKDTKLINMQTTKTVSPGVMVFRVQHRFGNMGVQSVFAASISSALVFEKNEIRAESAIYIWPKLAVVKRPQKTAITLIIFFIYIF